jgi:hypothetical protein
LVRTGDAPECSLKHYRWYKGETRGLYKTYAPVEFTQMDVGVQSLCKRPAFLWRKYSPGLASGFAVSRRENES